ncbi:hypothetical protein FH063_006523 [Azospirillum argentinense]|uniref:Uncharacterized protein n=1 Tax=Azospirillum argentinense TaxID=2970906 RepID=A0A5B0KNL8_9PROT|nr:hypothetical protein FH063_006523 [Azospirillum argentinense]
MPVSPEPGEESPISKVTLLPTAPRARRGQSSVARFLMLRRYILSCKKRWDTRCAALLRMDTTWPFLVCAPFIPPSVQAPRGRRPRLVRDTRNRAPLKGVQVLHR